jgi:hypothetical protein
MKVKEESSSFLKKRTKKLLHAGAWAGANPLPRRRREQKFFASFFQKRSPSFHV